MKNFCFLLFLIFVGISAFSKNRVVILTDIANEPDDKMSMVRLMLYSNELDIEGLIATTSCWMKTNPQPKQIEEVVNAYAQVRGNLLLHAPGYPVADSLKNLIKKGNSNYSMTDVGDGKSTDGSNHIIKVVDRNDSRPVWICVWGGTNTLAQALWDVKRTRTPEELAKFISKIRIYDIGGQDDCGAWMAHNFPYLYYIRSLQQWHGISYRIDKLWPESRGGDESVVTPQWVDTNIQKNHGPLGEKYPNAAYLHEGDTPSFLYLMQNGLSNPDEPTWGCWGGRFKENPQMNPWSSQPPVSKEKNYKDFWMINEDKDQWQWNDKVYNNEYSAIFRWRVDFQNDFAARMDWCTQSFENANHNPVIVLNNDSTKDILSYHVNPGDTISLKASDSYDADGDSLLFKWWVYQEPGTYKNSISLAASDSSTLKLVIPIDAAGKSIHLILTVKDDGIPQLSANKRVVFYVEPYLSFKDTTPPAFTSCPDSEYIDYRIPVPITISTDERAFLKYDYAEKSFGEMQFSFEEGEGGIQHTTPVQAKQGDVITIYVQAKDMSGNETTKPILVKFSVDTISNPVNVSKIQSNSSTIKVSPNPFSSYININFEILAISHVSIKIFNSYEQEISELENKNYLPGKYSLVWDGKNSNNISVSNGVYFIRTQINEMYMINKVIYYKN